MGRDYVHSIPCPMNQTICKMFQFILAFPDLYTFLSRYNNRCHYLITQLSLSLPSSTSYYSLRSIDLFPAFHSHIHLLLIIAFHSYLYSLIRNGNEGIYKLSNISNPLFNRQFGKTHTITFSPM